jgi:membrane fusion protein (multidrug efflux system)
MSTPIQQSKTDRIITTITTVIAGLIAISLLVWGVVTPVASYRYEETNDAQIDEYINPVASRVTGYIREIHFEENEDVNKGDTLLLIDNTEYQLQQQEAEAALLSAKAQTQVLASNTQSSSSAALVTKAQIAAAKAKMERQQQEYARYKNLFDVESATRQQLENVKTALDVASSEYQSALQSYKASLSRVNDIASQRAVVQAEIKRREALLNRNKLDVGYTVIRAPYNGKMGRRTIQEGQFVQAGQTLAYIVDKDAGKWVIANFKETQLAHMQIGDTVQIETDAFPGKTFGGAITSLSPATGSKFSLMAPDNSTGNFVKIVQRIPVRIKITGGNPALQQLRAGMNANVTVRKNQHNNNG